MTTTSTALVPYDPTLPHISMEAHLEAVTDRAVRQSLEVAKFESAHLHSTDFLQQNIFTEGSIDKRLLHIAQHLPEMLPSMARTAKVESFPFSGIIALQAGDGPIVQACHCPNQPEFTTDQTFNALSIGKLFTATAVMQLIEDGVQIDGEEISLTTPLSKLLTPEELDVPLKPPYLEQKPDDASLSELRKHMGEITLEHLLSHTGGFVGREEDKEKGIAGGNNWDHSTIGKRCYSNYGYQLLGTIVGKHTNSGTPFINHEARFRAHIERRIFKRAGMEGARRESGRLVDGVYPLARHQPDCFEIPKEGPMKGTPQKVNPMEFPEPYPHGNGCWRMTTNDLFDFSRAIQHNLLISAKSFQDMQDRRLGFGVERDQNEAIIGYGHPGGGSGMSSFLHIWRTDPPVTAVVLSNHSGCEMVKPCLDPLMQQ